MTLSSGGVEARTPTAAIEHVTATAYVVPTDGPESDGTHEWDHTTVIVAEVSSRGLTGIGYTYAAAAARDVICRVLRPALSGRPALDVPAAFQAMLGAVRNIGRPGVASTAISAIDIALWDLKARLLGTSLLDLLGAVRESVRVYGSGGFTSYSDDRLQRQLGGWVADGMTMVKMKVGRDPAADRRRVRMAREAIGSEAELFVDANGAYDRTLAASQARDFAERGVCWFEEPVTSDDLDGLRWLRDHVPAPMNVAAGEYGYDVWYFRRMLGAGAVDVLQADGTRCGGVTGFLQASALCEAWHLPMSAHTAPHVHAYVSCAAPRIRHIEYFHDHARIEPLLFDGALTPAHGRLAPDRSRPGLGIEIKRRDADAYRV